MIVAMATKFEIEKFNGNNFSLWKLKMKAILRKDKCLAAIGERPVEVTNDSEWDEMDGNAIANLHLALADGVLSSIEEKKSAKEIWDHLARLYEARSLHNKKFLKRKLYALRMTESTSVTEHVNNLNTLFSQLTSLSCKIDSQERAEILLQSLPDSYDQVIINLTSNVLSDYLVFDDVAAAILEEENRRNNREDRQTSSRQVEALVVTRGRSMEPGSSGSHNHGKSKTGKKKNFKCFKCGKPGHFRKDCRGLNTSYPQGNVASTSEDGNALCCEAAVANESRKRFADVWLFDTGATFHMTARREWFHQYKPISGGGSVYSCNDHELKIIGIGSIMVKMHDGTVRTIRDVRHVEGLKKNLLSLGQLDDLGCKAEASVASHSPSHTVAVTWHQKFRHMSEQGMKILVEIKILPGLTKVSLPLSEHCVISKQHRLKRCWVYPIKKKSDVFEVFKVYKARVELDSGKKIKCLRTDNGGEYTGDEFNTFCKQEGIKRQFTTSYTPQQNGVAERMNRTFKGVSLVGPTAHKVVLCRDVFFMKDKIQENKEATPQHEVNETNESQAPATRTLNYKRRRPGWHSNYVMESNVAYCLLTEEGEPSTLQEALDNPDASFWSEAMQEEIKALHKNKTWELLPLPGGRKPIGNKWVSKIKKNDDDQVERYRARLVVKGYAQKEGIDFNVIFSLVVQMITIRVVLAMCATYDLHLEQLDVKTAFLHGNLEEEIYMLQLECFKQKGKENLVCRLHTYPCAYFKRFGNDDFIILLLYVDDMLVADPNKDRINKLKAQLAREFEMKDLRPANKILGMQIHRDRVSRKIWLSQKSYVKKILQRFNMQDCKPISTPFHTNVKLSSKMSPSSEKERMKMSRVSYASAVGSLMSAMICTSPDIAHAVGVGYVNSDYAGDLDGSKSTTGYVFTLCGGTVSWVSKLQSVVVMSTTEVEYVAAAQASKEAVWLKMLLEELGHEQEKITLFCDNQSALYLARNPTFHSKTKHIRVQYHFVCEKVEEGTLDMQKIHTDDNVADYLTKAINYDKFIWCRSSCGLAET
ncbi:retrovirus-related pol polyprotein from transposon TNT 1-94 [Tanacetum coccineum]